MNVFLTSRNQFDEQMNRDSFHAATCEMLIEASARRMIKVEGAHKTALRLQRLADIVAAIDVKPIEHWHQPAPAPVEACLEPEPIAPSPKPRSRLRRFLALAFGGIASPVVTFWAGFLLASWLAI